MTAPSTPRPDLRDVRARPAEGWIWGWPMVANYRTLYEQAVDPTSPAFVGFGRFRHRTTPFTPADTAVTDPDPDTLPSLAWLDLRAEPWVLSVPAADRYLVLPFHDLDTSYAGYVGTRTTGPGPGTFLIAGPGFQDDTPPGFHGTIQCDSLLVGCVGRTALGADGNTEHTRRIQDGYRLRPLHTFLGDPAPPTPPTVDWPVWREDLLTGVGFFQCLDFLLDFFPTLDREVTLRQRLASIGVDGSGRFRAESLDREVREAVVAGIGDARNRLDRAAASASGTTGWFGTRTQHGEDYLTRALGAAIRLHGLPAEEVWYGGWSRDADGALADGANADHVLRFPAGALPPARFRWSVSVYRLPEHTLVANDIGRYAVGGDTPGLVHDPDGGLTLRLSHRRPTDPAHAANWLPTPRGRFVVTLRLYGPEPSVLDGGWQPPPLVAHPHAARPHTTSPRTGQREPGPGGQRPHPGPGNGDELDSGRRP